VKIGRRQRNLDSLLAGEADSNRLPGSDGPAKNQAHDLCRPPACGRSERPCLGARFVIGLEPVAAHIGGYRSPHLRLSLRPATLRRWSVRGTPAGRALARRSVRPAISGWWSTKGR
jgi:hypothetical protein